MAHERQCVIDNTEYKYCPKCGGYNPDETWRFLFCSENCMEIYNLVEEYKTKKINGIDAKRKLQNLDLSNREHFTKLVRSYIDEIMESTAPLKIKKKKLALSEPENIVNDDFENTENGEA